MYITVQLADMIGAIKNMPLFIGTIESAVVVEAASETDAIQRIEDDIRAYAGRFADDLAVIDVCKLNNANELYDKWDKNCVPYGSTETIEEILDKD